MDLERALAVARASLDTIAREGPWAYADGHWPQSNRSGPVRGIVRLVPTSPDEVPGDRWDTGVGAYRPRQAYRAALGHVAWSDDAIALVLYVADRKLVQPPLAVRPVPVTARELPRLVAALRIRLTALEERYPAFDRALSGFTRDVLEGRPRHREAAVLRRLDAAALELSGAMQVGQHDPIGTVVAMCRYGCGRPAGSRKGGKCDACHQADYRGRGADARLDARAEKLEVRRIHARHRAAGHGHGHD